MPFLSGTSLQAALDQLWGTADHMLKIWLTVKRMGMVTGGPGIKVDTSNPTPALKRLFSFGDPDGSFFVPFAHTERFATMKSDAARSIIQTNVKRWEDSGSVVTINPTGYLDFTTGPNDEVLVSAGRSYPVGLGSGKDGFAREDGARTTVPWTAFCAWYCRQVDIPASADPTLFIEETTRSELNLSDAEIEAVFVQVPLSLTLQTRALSEAQVYKIVTSHLARPGVATVLVAEAFTEYAQRIKAMVTTGEGPAWLRLEPETSLKNLIAGGAKAILLYGPPRTGKTRAIDSLFPRNTSRATIQLHDGWGYDELMVSLRPDDEGKWNWTKGPLLEAIESGKSVVVLEEANRTPLTQALGEVFSLLEEKYRGPGNAITLRSGEKFFIPEDTLIIAIINTLDKSTEDIDDAVLGRMAGVEFPPRVEDLARMLKSSGMSTEDEERVRQFFSFVQSSYPLGHGYLAALKPGEKFIPYYVSRIRPVLKGHLDKLRANELTAIDNKVDALFKS